MFVLKYLTNRLTEVNPSNRDSKLAALLGEEMSDIHQEVIFAASPARVYRALTDSAEHAAFTTAPADISSEEGGAFSAHGGFLVGRNVSLVPNKRIVQAWRGKDWPEGHYSIVRFELAADGDKTRLTFDQSGVPENVAKHIDEGWKKMYWERLHKYLNP
jgi:activator of HSP90 ATPase